MKCIWEVGYSGCVFIFLCIFFYLKEVLRLLVLDIICKVYDWNFYFILLNLVIFLFIIYFYCYFKIEGSNFLCKG